jgi:hypothetical protein
MSAIESRRTYEAAYSYQDLFINANLWIYLQSVNARLHSASIWWVLLEGYAYSKKGMTREAIETLRMAIGISSNPSMFGAI